MKEQIRRLTFSLRELAKRVSQPGSENKTFISDIDEKSPYFAGNDFLEYIAPLINSEKIFVVIRDCCTPGSDHCFKVELVRNCGKGKIKCLLLFGVHFDENVDEPKHGLNLKIEGFSAQGFDLSKKEFFEDLKHTMAFAQTICDLIETFQILKAVAISPEDTG